MNYENFTEEELRLEYQRLDSWRELWRRLSHRQKVKGRDNAIFLSQLTVRDERIQRRASRKNGQIASLMSALDALRAKNSDYERKICASCGESYANDFAASLGISDSNKFCSEECANAD